MGVGQGNSATSLNREVGREMFTPQRCPTDKFQIFGIFGALRISDWTFQWTYMGVSENSGTPKSSILIGLSSINHPFWGTPIFGNIHIFNEKIEWDPNPNRPPVSVSCDFDLLDTQVDFRGPWNRGSDRWRFLGCIAGFWNLQTPNHQFLRSQKNLGD